MPEPISRAVRIAAGYDCAVDRTPVGYKVDSATLLMFGQMWEKRKSVGFDILQFCPPHRRPDVTASTS